MSGLYKASLFPGLASLSKHHHLSTALPHKLKHNQSTFTTIIKNGSSLRLHLLRLQGQHELHLVHVLQCKQTRLALFHRDRTDLILAHQVSHWYAANPQYNWADNTTLCDGFYFVDNHI